MVARIHSLRSSGDRVLVGIVGEPGSGKSTVAQALIGALGGDVAATVPMDGFHLGQAIINGTELASRKGAIDTFDVGGYASLLRRIRADDEAVVYAPTYVRTYEEPIGSSIAVPASARIVITEGNYLLAGGPWDAVRDQLDEVWFLRTPGDLRMARLIARHIEAGKEPAAAEAWARGSDERNAEFIRSTAESADAVIVLE